MNEQHAGPAGLTRGQSVAWWIGMALHVLALPWYAASGLVAPGWAVVGLLVLWLALLAAGIATRRRTPVAMLAIPVLDVAIWFGVVTVGELLLNWTA
ncbi:MAG TPA: hypothetical protein VK028_10890 [Micromonosporaceae bacterium]|nr:hypothetical protein [Micromonosporaceae bacterium]